MIVDRNGNPLQPQIVIPRQRIGCRCLAERVKSACLIGNGREPQNIGQIQVVNFVNPAGLKSMGKNIFVPSGASGLPQQGLPGQNGYGQLAQGELEASNVNIVEEMVNMITAQRSYETNSKVIQASDQMLQYMNQLR